MLFKLLILASAVSAISCATECGSPAFPPNEVSSHIVGGVEARRNSWPWMVQVQLYGGHYCGGTLISDEWIVSAAHCFDYPQKEYQFSAGGHVIDNFGESTRQTEKALEIIKHKDYNPRTYANDIALIRVDPFDINEYVSPACLTSTPTGAGADAYVTGWGDQEKVFEDENLQQVMVPIVSEQDCKRSYPFSIDETMICAGYPEGGKDSCQGDSGGPLVVKNWRGKWDLVGIVSWGIGCADKGNYGVYAEASHFYDWIREETGL